MGINGIETGANDPLVRDWVFYGLFCIFTRREKPYDALWDKLSAVGKKMWHYYPHEFFDALDKDTMDTLMETMIGRS
jgi:hypothetical protein